MDQKGLSESLKETLKMLQDTNHLVIRLNFFLVDGKPEKYRSVIQQNVDELNRIFIDKIYFITSAVSTIENSGTLPELYRNYLDGGDMLSNLISNKEEKGFINIIVMKTATEEENRVLHGFTPLYYDYFEGYAAVAPEMDRVIISYEGLEYNSTLFHELGHYFSLSHPWELTEEQLVVLGLDNPKDECINHMNYNCFVNTFTEQQLMQMKMFAMRYRGYLVLGGEN